MEDGQKAIVGLGILGLFGLVAAVARRGPAPGAAATVSVALIDAVTGEVVPHNSPATLVEGGSYYLSLVVTNATTRAGAPWAASLTLRYGASVGVTTLLPIAERTDSYPAGGSLSFTSPTFTVPVTLGGLAGAAWAAVLDPSRLVLVEAEEPLTVLAAGLIYGAGVSVTVV